MHPAARRLRRWPWIVAGATIALFAVANVVYPADEADLVFTVVFSAITLAFVLVGALLTSRVPGNLVGPLILGAGVTLAAVVAIGTFAVIATEIDGFPEGAIAIAGIVNDVGLAVPIVIVLVGVPLVFPDGHLLSKPWRWIVVLAVAALACTGFAALLGPGPVGSTGLPNPFHVPALAGVAEALDAFASWTSILGFGAAVAAVVIRYRQGDDIQRHQLKWLIAVAGVAAVAFPVSFIRSDSVMSDWTFMIGLVALFLFPLAIAAAVLRYRLYDIDRIISRSIAWAVISGLLLASFVVLVVGLQAALTGVTQGETLAVAMSTLIAFALFQPVRRTVQRAVDRRFDRARYDAHRTTESFADRLRNEVDLDTLAAELEATVHAAIRPTAASLWLPRREPR